MSLYLLKLFVISSFYVFIRIPTPYTGYGIRSIFQRSTLGLKSVFLLLEWMLNNLVCPIIFPIDGGEKNPGKFIPFLKGIIAQGEMQTPSTRV